MLLDKLRIIVSFHGSINDDNRPQTRFRHAPLDHQASWGSFDGWEQQNPNRSSLRKIARHGCYRILNPTRYDCRQIKVPLSTFPESSCCAQQRNGDAVCENPKWSLESEPLASFLYRPLSTFDDW